MNKTKKIKLEKILLLLGVLLIILISEKLIKKYTKSPINRDLKNYEKILNEQWPGYLLDSSLSKINDKKLIYVYSNIDCEQCIISHLKLLKAISDSVNINTKINIQLIGIGKSVMINYKKYKKILELDFPFKYINSNQIKKLFPHISIPFFVILNNNNKIIAAWRADVEKIYYSKIKIKNILLSVELSK